MAQTSIPDPLERRHLLERELDPAQAGRIADAYIEAGRVAEAIAFLAKADAPDRLAQLAEEAVATGDGFAYKEICRALGRETTEAEWARLAEAAEALGKLRYASTARRQIDLRED